MEFLIVLVILYALLPIINLIRQSLANSEIESLKRQIKTLKTSQKKDGFTPTPKVIVESEKESSKPTPPIAEPTPPPKSPEKVIEPPILSQPKPEVIQQQKAEEKSNHNVDNIFNWLIYGKSQPQENNLEITVASNWLLRLGILLTIIGVGYFLKYSIDQGWISPTTRLLSSGITGMSILLISTRFTKGKYHLLAYAGMGLGLCMSYLTLFAGHHLYENLIPLPWAFAGTCTTTLLSVFIAHRYQSQLLAIIGLSGGIATPLLLEHAGIYPYHTFMYLNIIALGISYLASKNQWQITNYLCLLSLWGTNTYIVYEHNFSVDHEIKSLAALSGLFLTFHISPIIHSIVHNSSTERLNMVALAFNTMAFFGLGYAILEPTLDRPWISIFPLGLALFHACIGLLLKLKKWPSIELKIYHVGMVGLFTAISAPLALSENIITLSWCVLALTLVWISLKIESELLRKVAYLIFAASFARYMYIDLSELHPEKSTELTYFKDLLIRSVTHGLSILSLFLTYLLYSFHKSEDDLSLTEEKYFFLGASLVLFIVWTSLELNLGLRHFLPTFRMGGLSIYWTISALGLISFGILQKIKPIRMIGLCALVLIAAKLLIIDLSLLDSFWRIIASITVGILMSFGSFLYLRFEERLSLSQ